MRNLHRTMCVLLLLFPTCLLAAEPVEIRYNTIVEAKPDQVWRALVEPDLVARWLFYRVEEWSPETSRDARVFVAEDAFMPISFVVADPPRRLQATLFESGSTLTIAIEPLDEHLTMLTLVHDSFKEEVAHARLQNLKDRWMVAMMKLHRLFPPSVVDTRMHRPRVKGLFIERSLIINGDFEFPEKGKYEGTAFGWETTTARSSPEVHGLDDKVFHVRGRSQRIARPPDWTNFTIQQFTPQVGGLIKPGKRYRLTGWVRAEGIDNPAGWYRLGLWFTDINGKPIGDFARNPQLKDPDGKPLLNHGWQRYVIEAAAPRGAARAVVILSGHWDSAGTVWYDDINLWDAEPPPTTRKR